MAAGGYPKLFRNNFRNESTRLNEVLRGWLSSDGSAVMVDGGIGYGCFVRPQSDAFIEEYEFDPTTCSDRLARSDWSVCAQLQAVVLGVRTHPTLAELCRLSPLMRLRASRVQVMVCRFRVARSQNEGHADLQAMLPDNARDSVYKKRCTVTPPCYRQQR